MLIYALVILIVAFVFITYKYFELKKINLLQGNEIESLKMFQLKAIQLESENVALSKYKEIIDVEKYIQSVKQQVESDKQHAEERIRQGHKRYEELLEEARRDAGEIKSKAEFILSENLKKVEVEKSLILKSAKDEAKNIREKSEKIMADADLNSKSIITKANEEAKKIAGDAYDALKKAEQLEKTAKAMKNIIDGYGDLYIIPTYNLIDQLAEDFSHTQAGEELKRAREKTRSMIKNGSASTCDYVEDNRKQTAIDFVLDAFNGKVDSILANVKGDNFGTLQQKINDAFHTVNYNGKAFKDARILELYLSSRLDELKWACTVQALKDKEREEQRRIREQIREEEKATKEYEKAMKEIQKEEESINKAIDKVKKDLEIASEAQKVEYEQKLNELAKKLKEAEEKNQRALSMAQQTKTGHVYIISNIGSFGDDVLKIGMTRRLDPMDRVDELGDASVPFDFDVHAMIMSEDAPALEKELHKRFSKMQINKVNPRKEFFNLKITELRSVIEEMGINTHWTMTAEAREYKESVSLEKNEKKVA